MYGRLYDYGITLTATATKEEPVRDVALGYSLGQIDSLAKDLEVTINTFNELPKPY